MKGKNSNKGRVYKFLVFINYGLVFGILLSYLSTYVAPSSNSLLPFFGLIYPILLFGNILFLILWLFKKRKIFLLSLIVLLLGFTHISHFFQFTFLNRNDSEKKTELKLISYNVRAFDLYNWTENLKTRDKMFTFLEGEKPDIISFQEFFWNSSPDAKFKTKNPLKKLLNLKYHTEGYTAITSKKEHFGLCTMSKYPIIDKGLVEFENDDSNGFIFSDIVINSDTIRVYNAHIGSARFKQEDYQAIGTEGNFTEWPRKKTDKQSKVTSRLKHAYIKREQQTKQLLAHIDTSPYPVSVCGDFNDTPVSYNYRQLTRNMYDSFTLSANGVSGTYVKLPFQRIDYILHDEFFNTFDYKRHTEDYSDHHAISATLEF